MIKLEKYRDLWLAKFFKKAIGFYPREFYCLDNFSAFKVKYKGIVYSTVEHAYQSQKFVTTDKELAKKIRDAFSPDEAKKIANANSDKIRNDWTSINLDLMLELIRLKTHQNPYVKQKLLQTGNYPIVEDSPYDEFWGIGKNRKGENHMGKIWMQVRKELRETSNSKNKLN